MATKKYEIVEVEGVKRIKALKDIGNRHIDVKAGDIGGVVESEDNLSQKGKCWIGYDASVRGKAKVSGNAAVVKGYVEGYAKVYGDAFVDGNGAYISGKTNVYENAQIFGNVRIGYTDEKVDFKGPKIHIHEHARIGTDVPTWKVSIMIPARISGTARIIPDGGNIWFTHGQMRDGDVVRIFGQVLIIGNGNIQDNVVIGGNSTQIRGYFDIKDNVCILGTTIITSEDHTHQVELKGDIDIQSSYIYATKKKPTVVSGNGTIINGCISDDINISGQLTDSPRIIKSSDVVSVHFNQLLKILAGSRYALNSNTSLNIYYNVNGYIIVESVLWKMTDVNFFKLLKEIGKKHPSHRKDINTVIRILKAIIKSVK